MYILCMVMMGNVPGDQEERGKVLGDEGIEFKWMGIHEFYRVSECAFGYPLSPYPSTHRNILQHLYYGYYIYDIISRNYSLL